LREGAADVGIAAGGGCSADVPHAWFATELHVEMLPDWMPIANDGWTRLLAAEQAFFVPQLPAPHEMCVAQEPFQVRPGFDHVCSHDEFNGAQEVSPIHRTIMIAGPDRLRPTAAACAMVLVAFAGNALADEDASAWDGDARSAVRLIAGSSAAPAPMRAGIEIRLQPGWHTYWRYPGDAGVPPRFDFSGSHNVGGVTVLWPAPQRIPEQGLHAIGYTKDVILPLLVEPQDSKLPMTLHLQVDYAVCEKLCVPAQGTAQLALTRGPSSRDGALARAQLRVPKRLALGEGLLAIRSVQRERSAPRSRVIIDVAAPADAGVELFVEGPSSDWALPLPTAGGAGGAGLQRFAFDLDGAPPGAHYEGARITVTAVAGDDAIEVAAALD
jgi:DsbC/DsbD-like thiol-disulfide interchange protein